MRPGAWGATAGMALLAASPACEIAVSLDSLAGGCPPRPGPAAVKVDTPNGAFCVDSTEVTNAQYADFLAAIADGPSNVEIGPGCPSAMTNFTPDDPMSAQPVWPTHASSYPVTHVNWCDAYAYCKWAGKRLCGNIGGGSLMQYNSPVPMFTEQVSQWLYACTAGGKAPYPYGSAFAPVCVGASTGAAVAPAATSPGCVGGYPGIYDMTGNVWEWLDSCGSDQIQAFCSSFGGGYDSPNADLSCLSQRWWTRVDGAADLGFRCCGDP